MPTSCLVLAAALGLADPALPASIPAPAPEPGGWVETFDAWDPARWRRSGPAQAPFWAVPGLAGHWREAQAEVVDGALVLTTVVQDGVVAAAEVQGREALHYGAYEFAVMVEPQEGLIGAVFSYRRDSETEIDLEFEGRDPRLLHAVTWTSVNDKQHTAHAMAEDPSGRWLRLRYEWGPDAVSFHLDGALVAEHRDVVPSSPAFVTFNLWPTDNPAWGGRSTNGTGRLRIDWMRFTPAPSPSAASSP